jgi:tRNA threonylcarbamoyladenosine biosynthesis protein TsaE
MPDSIELNFPSENDTAEFAKKMAAVMLTAAQRGPSIQVHLNGNLGSGKTTFTRYLLQAMGVVGAVRSPTYTLIEPYDLGDIHCQHLDLYRVADPEELEYLGLSEMSERAGLTLIEWPSKGLGFLPPADLDLSFDYLDEGRQLLVKALTLNKRNSDIIERLQPSANKRDNE